MKIKKAWIAIVGVLTMALTAFLGARRDKKVKELKKVINNSKKVEKGITSEIKTLEKDKKTNKKQITNNFQSMYKV